MHDFQNSRDKLSQKFTDDTASHAVRLRHSASSCSQCLAAAPSQTPEGATDWDQHNRVNSPSLLVPHQQVAPEVEGIRT